MFACYAAVSRFFKSYVEGGECFYSRRANIKSLFVSEVLVSIGFCYVHHMHVARRFIYGMAELNLPIEEGCLVDALLYYCRGDIPEIVFQL